MFRIRREKLSLDSKPDSQVLAVIRTIEEDYSRLRFLSLIAATLLHPVNYSVSRSSFVSTKVFSRLIAYPVEVGGMNETLVNKWLDHTEIIQSILHDTEKRQLDRVYQYSTAGTMVAFLYGMTAMCALVWSVFSNAPTDLALYSGIGVLIFYLMAVLFAKARLKNQVDQIVGRLEASCTSLPVALWKDLNKGLG